jgi:hypothetical protein
VSEESERVGFGPEGNGVGIDPAAMALALDGVSRETADAFLNDQRKLIAAQLDLTPSEKAELARHP